MHEINRGVLKRR